MHDEPAVPPFLLRGLARGIDVLLYLQVIEAGARIRDFLPPGLFPMPGDVRVWFDIAFSFTAIWIYPTVAEGLTGATLGKLLTGMRVVDVSLERPGWRAVALRNLGLFLDLPLFGLIAYSAIRSSPVGQRLGDSWGGTRVVWRGDAPQRPAWYGWVVGHLAAIAVIAASYLLIP